jgi:probable phosphoglycerate mutase
VSRGHGEGRSIGEMTRSFPNPGFPRFPRTSTDVLLVRHGESEPAVEGRAFPTKDGHGDPALSALGRDQAERLAERLAGSDISALYVSSLRRTHETAAPLAARLEIEPRIEPDLREVHLGEWEGGLYRQMAAESNPAFLEHVTTGSWNPIPGSEGDYAFCRRVRQAILEISQRHRGEQIVAVTHGGVIGALIADATGSGRAVASVVDQTSITRLVVVGDRLVLRSLNDTHHLGDATHATLWADEVD